MRLTPTPLGLPPILSLISPLSPLPLMQPRGFGSQWLYFPPRQPPQLHYPAPECFTQNHPKTLDTLYKRCYSLGMTTPRRGTPITLRAAARTYGVWPKTLSRWVHHGLVAVIAPATGRGHPLTLDEADVSRIVAIYYRNPGRGKRTLIGSRSSKPISRVIGSLDDNNNTEESPISPPDTPSYNGVILDQKEAPCK